MSIVYILSLVMLFVTVILVKKSNQKLDFIKTATIIVVLFLCYQIFISFLCTIVNIPITLLSLSIINIIIIAVLLRKIIYKKEIQKYKYETKDILVISILLIIVFVISYLDFGLPFNIKYIMTDAAVHFTSVREFYENENLLLKAENIKSAKAMMPGAYSNIGILFKVFASWIGEMNLYKVFIGFDIFVFFLSGVMFFVTIKKYAKNKLTYILAVALSIIYLLGYPLNNILFGYFYLGIGVLIINAIVAIMQEWKEIQDINIKGKLLTLFLLCFGLFFSYYLFVPPVYGAIFVYYLLYFYKQKNKWINKEMIIYTLVTLLIPAIMGFCYHVLPGMLSTDQIQVGNAIQMEGYIYRNLYSNILLFIPFAIYYLAKEKNIQFDMISVVIWVIYMCVLYVGIFKLNISTYYFFKTYFVLWQFAIYLCFRGICYINDKKHGEIITSTYILCYIMLMIISFCTSDVEITKDRFNKNEKITDVMDIFGINKTVLFRVETDYTTNELEILNYIKENDIQMKNNNTLLIANQRQEFWFWAILEYRFKNNLESATSKAHIELWNNGTYEYLVYFNRSDYYNLYKNIMDLDGKEVIFQNESGAIIKNK